MVAINQMWATASQEERRAFHNVCCLNSWAKDDLKLTTGLNHRIQAALNALEVPQQQSLAE